jgi:hypothetical protein
MSYNDDFQYSVKEIMGYTKIQTDAPPQELVTEVERSLRSRPNVVSGPITYGRGDHDACESYLKFGIQDGDVCLSTRGRHTELTSMEVHQQDRRSDREARFSSPPRPGHRPLAHSSNQLGNQCCPPSPKWCLGLPNPVRRPGGQSDNLEALSDLPPLVERRIRTGKRNIENFQFAIERGTVRARRTQDGDFTACWGIYCVARIFRGSVGDGYVSP